MLAAERRLTTRPSGWGHLPRWLRIVLRNVAPFIPILAIWQLAVSLELWPRSFLPAPAAIPDAAVELWTDGELLRQVGETLARVTVGALLGLALGVVVAVLLALLPRVWAALHDVLSYLQAIGEIGWLPLFILWSGFNNRTIVITIGYTVFFPVFFGTLSGFRSVPQNLASSVRTLGGTRWNVLREVLLPGSLPAMITGLRAGMGFGWRTVILAEMLVAQTGLGVILFNARSFFRTDWIIVGMIVVGVIWLLTDKLLLQPLEARTIRRWGIQRRPA